MTHSSATESPILRGSDLGRVGPRWEFREGPADMVFDRYSSRRSCARVYFRGNTRMFVTRYNKGDRVVRGERDKSNAPLVSVYDTHDFLQLTNGCRCLDGRCACAGKPSHSWQVVSMRRWRYVRGVVRLTGKRLESGEIKRFGEHCVCAQT
jgi:hypothetical protein